MTIWPSDGEAAQVPGALPSILGQQSTLLAAINLVLLRGFSAGCVDVLNLLGLDNVVHSTVLRGTPHVDHRQSQGPCRCGSGSS